MNTLILDDISNAHKAVQKARKDVEFAPTQSKKILDHQLQDADTEIKGAVPLTGYGIKASELFESVLLESLNDNELLDYFTYDFDPAEFSYNRYSFERYSRVIELQLPDDKALVGKFKVNYIKGTQQYGNAHDPNDKGIPGMYVGQAFYTPTEFDEITITFDSMWASLQYLTGNKIPFLPKELERMVLPEKIPAAKWTKKTRAQVQEILEKNRDAMTQRIIDIYHFYEEHL